MKNNIKFVGLDVSKDTIAIGIADTGREAPRFHGTIANTPEAVRKLIGKLGSDAQLEVCYEAGPTGYGLGTANFIQWVSRVSWWLHHSFQFARGIV
ncbi:hypothetical protein [Alicyclobacillus fodiniaquatilis]|uniref:Transposase n=1 Tax=Alicyclobacillus fodiniaquatilis TaxID=1661150 RepID=A0ABW4JNT6_9BACL